MNTSLQPWIEPIAWTLLHSLWQAAALAILARAIAAALRTRSASFAATLHALAMAGVFVAAAFTFSANLKPQLAPPPSTIAQAAQAPLSDFAANPTTAIPAEPAVSSSLLPALVTAWAIGVALMSLRLAAGALWLWRLRRTATPWADQAWQAKFRQWLDDLGIRRAVRLCTTVAHETPAVIGHFKPLVLLPAALIARLTPEQLEAVLLHELMHIRRHDYLVNLLRVAAETLFFFNPAVWWISRAIRLEREVACDQLVAARTGNKLGYAKTLLRLEELHLAQTGDLALAASSGPLKTRIARLLAMDRPAPALAAWTGLACLALLLATLAAFGLPKTFAADATQPSRFQLRSVVEPGTADSETLPLLRTTPDGEASTNQLVIAKKVLLDESHFATAKVVYDPISNRPEIEIRLTPEGATLFKKITEQHVRRQIAIVIEGKVQSAPVVNEPITGGSLRISGSFTDDEARQLAEKMAPKKRSSADSTEQIAAPNWTPPPGSLPSKILEEARADRRAGRYEEALAKHVWYHTASRQEPGQGGVRLSFAMSDWLALGQAYPPALAKMKQMRADTEQALRSGGVEADRFTLFHEYSGFNWVLREEQKTLDLYRWIEEQDAALAKQIRPVADSVSVRLRQNAEHRAGHDLEREFIEAREQHQYLSRALDQLKALERKGSLRKTLTVVFPDAPLDRLLADLSKAEQTFAQLSVDYSAEHPEVMKIKALLKVINQQIDERIGAIMAGLEVKVSAAKAIVDELEKKQPATTQKL